MTRSSWPLAALTMLLACQSEGGSEGSANGGGAGGTPADAAVPDSGGGGDLRADADPPDAAPSTDAGPSPGDAAPPDALMPDAAPPGPPPCEHSDLPAQPFRAEEDPAAGFEFGAFRHDLARDFSTVDVDGAGWRLSEHWNGCESFVFLTDAIPLSDADPTPAWTADLGDLLDRSPRNVNYLFVSRSSAAETARGNVTRVREAVEAELAGRPAEEADHWRAHLHFFGEPASEISGWVKSALRGHGQRGLAVDRFQRIRGVGSFADVMKQDPAAQAAGGWPWKNNIAYAAHEARRFAFEADRAARLAAEPATVVDLLGGEVVAGFHDLEVDLPSAEELAAFDTLEIEVEQRCPNGEAAEPGNCGAWDYLAHLWLTDEADQRTEVARFITSYHRETHWVIDVSQMLPLLTGGHTRFRWEFAPEWNTQPTATWLKLRFLNRNKGFRPSQLVRIGQGGGFGSMYNTARMPVSAEIPADAKRVELYAVITGHGAEAAQCAEFCNHQHRFAVNGHPHMVEFREAQDPDGCVDQVERGMTPNQYGTWWFGRGGWCPGQQVDPHVIDVTDEAAPGSTATVEYEGLFGGRTPPDGSGNIVLESWLVVSR